MSIDAVEPDPEDEDRDEEEPAEEPALVVDEATKKPRRRTPIESMELAREIWTETFSGMSQRDIAQLHGISIPMVRHYQVKAARRYRRKEIEQIRRTDLDRIEAMIDAFWERAIREHRPESTKLVLTMIKMRADILGYAAPRKVEHSGETKVGVTPELAELLRQRREQNEVVRGELERVQAAIGSEILDGEVVDDDDRE